MPLDPNVEKLIQWAARAGHAPMNQVGPAAARAFYDRAALALELTAEPMHSVEDMQVELPGRTLRIRHYVPREHGWAEPMPALLFFHGGGFTIGSVDTHDRICRRLAKAADCLVLSVDYRLAPEHRFPAAVDDAFDALAWLREQAGLLGVDAARIAVGGDSAGGTLAAATAIHARDRGWPLALQLLIYPGLAARQDTASHRTLAEGVLLDADVIQWFFGNYLRSEADRNDWRFAPLVHPDLTGVAPAWVGLPEYDPLHDEGRLYALRLREAGVLVREKGYAGMIHAFFHHGSLVPMARQAQADAAAALREAFGRAGA